MDGIVCVFQVESIDNHTAAVDECEVTQICDDVWLIEFSCILLYYISDM